MTSPEDVVSDNTPEAIDMQSEGGASTPLDPQLELEQIRAELRESNDRALRANAELENYRKRARREMEDERKYADLPLLRDLLPVLDNLRRAIDAAEQAPGSDRLLEGVKMVGLQINSLLEQHACRKIPTLGEPFDPHLHEAISQSPSSEYVAGTVLREVQVGYVLHDRVVRPAQVFVSAGAQS